MSGHLTGHYKKRRRDFQKSVTIVWLESFDFICMRQIDEEEEEEEAKGVGGRWQVAD